MESNFNPNYSFCQSKAKPWLVSLERVPKETGWIGNDGGHLGEP